VQGVYPFHLPPAQPLPTLPPRPLLLLHVSGCDQLGDRGLHAIGANCPGRCN
jgi:hypothetical protein